MRFSTIVTATSMAGLAHALPADQAASTYIIMEAFENTNWQGSSITFPVMVQTECYAIGSRESKWSNRISSIKVPSGYRCRLWDSNSCNGDSSPDIYSPGAGELGSMNDKTTSFKCYSN